MLKIALNIFILIGCAIFIPGLIMFLLATWRLRSGKKQEGSICSFHVGNERHTGTIIKSGKMITVVRSHTDRQKYNVFTKDLCI